MVASEGVRETGTVASARAAEIYGLDVLAEGIQVRFLTDPFNHGAYSFFLCSMLLCF